MQSEAITGVSNRLQCRVLVTGPRDYADAEFVWSTLSALHDEQPISVIIHGACPTGVDDFADRWAKATIGAGNVERYPAQWDKIDGLPARDVSIRVNGRGKPYNALAGFNRNSDMLRLGCPTIVVGFPCPRRPLGTQGTGDMLRKARHAEATGAALAVQIIKHPNSTF